MMSVKQIKEVRMMRQEGLPIREICRKAGISRNTVRKILRGQQARFKYDRKARHAFIKALVANFTPKQYFSALKAGQTPFGIVGI